MATFTSLIDLYCGGTLECQQADAIADVHKRGKLLAQAGDSHWKAFTRSTLKALQALPFMQADEPRQASQHSGSHSS